MTLHSLLVVGGCVLWIRECLRSREIVFLLPPFARQSDLSGYQCCYCNFHGIVTKLVPDMHVDVMFVKHT